MNQLIQLFNNSITYIRCHPSLAKRIVNIAANNREKQTKVIKRTFT